MSAASSSRERQFQEYLSEGITAARSGNRSLAQSLLNRAILVNGLDARPYIWLSATTDDPDEQREYLEKAVAIDPTNAAARRGLALLVGKIDPSQLAPQGSAPGQRQPDGALDASGHTFQCPQCGGRMTFSISAGVLTCEYCGYEQSDTAVRGVGAVADRAEQVFDFVMPTRHGHAWAEAQHRLSCQHCGALTILPPGRKAMQCAYCGSNQLVESSEYQELIDPQVIAVMQIDEKAAVQRVQEWLGKGVFTPDTLTMAGQRVRLRPAYYSFWTFDGTIEVRWTCEVAEGSGNSKRWTPRSGVEMQFFSDALVQGVKALSDRELASIEPFNLVEVEQFKAGHLAGWPAIFYDRSLSDASLVGRQKVMKQMRSQLYDLIEIGREKRNVNFGAGSWSGLTFKHILLPIWMGAYQFQGKEYHVLVNGQTGKVGGDKPRDTFKLIFAILIAAMFILLLLALYWVFSGQGLPF